MWKGKPMPHPADVTACEPPCGPVCRFSCLGGGNPDESVPGRIRAVPGRRKTGSKAGMARDATG